MSDELNGINYMADSVTVKQLGRIIPSPALAEAAILGAAQIIAERDELRAKLDEIPWLALRILVCDPNDWPGSYEEMQRSVIDWIDNNAPFTNA